MIVTVFKKGREKDDVFLNKDYVVKVVQLSNDEAAYRGVDAVCGIELHNGEYITVQGSLEEIIKLIKE